MADVTGASLAPIYNRLNTTPSYHPLEADTFADWSIEAGDVVTVTRDGRGYQSPVHSSTVTWKKQPKVTISSTGNEERESVTKMSQKKYGKGGSALNNSQYQHWFVEDKYNQMRAGLELTASSASLYVDDRYRQMKAGLDLTSSSASLYVEDKYRQMKSGLDLTSSSAALYVDDRYKQMKSGLNLTSSSASLYVDNRYAQMRAGLNLTSSSAALYVDNKYDAMKSGLNLTSSSAALYVDNKYDAMKSGLALTSSTAAMYVHSKTTKAELILSITGGKSNAKLTADTIDIQGLVNDLTAYDVTVKSLNAHQIVSDGECTFDSIDVESLNITGEWPQVIVDASVSNNELTLTYNDGTEVNFSKATTLAGRWDSGTYTVTASPQGNDISTTLQILSPDGGVSRSGKSVTRLYKAYYGSDETHTAYTGFQQSITIDASSVWDAGQDAKHVDEIRITGNGNRYWSGSTYYQNVGVAADYNTGGSYVTAIAVDVTGAYDAGKADAPSVTDYGIYDTDSNKRSGTVNLGWNGSIDLWAGYTTDNGASWHWGSKLTVQGKAFPSVGNAAKKSSDITGTSAGDVSSQTGNYVTFTVGGYDYYIKIA